MPLPQNHAWQVDLRSWLQGLTESNFDCGLPGLSYDDSWLTSTDDVYRLYLTFENSGRYLVGLDGVRMAAENYVLSSIERDGKVYFRTQHSSINGPQTACLAWLYQWDWQGNPYHQSIEVANRALVSAIVDMMMVDDKWIVDDPAGGVTGESTQYSQYSASGFTAQVYAFYVCGDLLPDAVQDAFKIGITRAFEVFEKLGSTGIQADMDTAVLPGLWYMGQVMGGDYPARAEAYCNAFMDKHLREAGYIDHGGGFDTSYQGISLYYMAWAANVSGYDSLIDGLGKIHRLKSHMSLLDVTGKWRSPSNFSTSTSFGVTQDQYYGYGRDMSLSYVIDEAEYTRYTGRNWLSYFKPSGVPPDEAEMRSTLARWSAQNSDPNGVSIWGMWGRPLEATFAEWDVSTQQRAIPYVWDFFPGDGFYSEVINGAGANVPFERDSDFVERFADEFVIWKLGDFGGIIHTGNLGWGWDTSGRMPGISGGSVAALWSKEGGIGLLGRQSGYAGSTPDTWATCATWAANHAYGLIGGIPYSSGRNKYPDVEIVTDDAHAMISASGTMKGEDADLVNTYSRTFRIDGEGLHVALDINDTGFDELWESLPFYLGEDEANGGQIQFLVDGLWIDATTEPVTATAAKLDRDGHIMLMTFSGPETVRLSDHVWTTTYQVDSRIRSVQLDVLGTGRARYTLSGAYVQELVKA